MSVEVNMAVDNDEQEAKTNVWTLFMQYMTQHKCGISTHHSIYLPSTAYMFDITLVLVGIPQQCLAGVRSMPTVQVTAGTVFTQLHTAVFMSISLG